MAAIDGRLPEVYAENANFAAFSVCDSTGMAVPFEMASADAVQQALAHGEALFPIPAVNAARDVAWNRRLVSSQLAQGLLLGESMPKIARRMQNVTDSNWATAMRTARTAVTAAENMGRVESYRRAREMGIRLQAEWLATLDGRTRHSHRMVDGERVGDGEKFSNGCLFPGDPSAPYSETMNCRCTTVAAVEGVDTSDAARWSRLPEGMTYEQWKAEGLRRKPQGNYRTPAPKRSVGADIIDLDSTFPEVRLPKKEYAKVLSAINANYHANHAGETFGSEVVDQDDGAYVYTFLVGEFNEYRIIGRERIE